MQGEESDKGSQFIFSNFGNGDGIGSTNFNPSQGQSSQGAYPPAYYPPQQQSYAYPQHGVGGYPSYQGPYPPSQQLHGYLQLGMGGYYGGNPVQGHGRAHKVLESLAGGAAAGAAAAAAVYHLVREHHGHGRGHYGKHGHGHWRKHAHNRSMF